MLVAIFGCFLLIFAWFLARNFSLKKQWLAFFIWILPLLVAPPVFSKDAFAYADQGFIVLSGRDPYTTGMGMIGGPFAAQVDSFWVGTTTVYPAFALWIQAMIVQFSGAHSFWSVVAMRIPALIGAVLVGAGISRIAKYYGRDQIVALWGTLLNPLLVLHFVGGSHNDSLATGLAVLAVWLAVHGRFNNINWLWLVAAIFVGLAMGIKQTMGLTALAVGLIGVRVSNIEDSPKQLWLANWRQALGRVSASVAITLLSFAATSWATGLGFGWATGTGAPFTVGSNSLSFMLCSGLAYLFASPIPVWLSTVGSAIFLVGLAGILTVLWRKGLSDPVAFLGWGLVLFVVASPTLQPWYLMWGGVFLAACRISRIKTAMVLSVSICAIITSILQDYSGLSIAVAMIVAALAYYPLFELISKMLPKIVKHHPKQTKAVSVKNS